MLQDLVNKIREIPPLSASAMRLMRHAGDEDFGPDRYAAVVEQDPALTMNVLRAANAPALGIRGEVTSVRRAVALLGARTVLGIALGTSCPVVFNKALAGYEAGRGDLWKSSLFTAAAARALSERCKTKLAPDTAFTAGILHDIGKAVIAEFLADRTTALVGAVSNFEEASFSDAERALLGADHAEAGYVLGKKWGLPESLLAAIRHHHQPALADISHRPLVYCVHLADITAMSAGFGTGADALRYRLDTGYKNLFDLDETALADVILTAQMEFERLAEPLAGE